MEKVGAKNRKSAVSYCCAGIRAREKNQGKREGFKGPGLPMGFGSLKAKNGLFRWDIGLEPVQAHLSKETH